MLGFGIEKDKSGNARAGKANRFLIDWILKNKAAPTLLLQEGTRLAALEWEAENGEPIGRELVLIHPHDEENYVNTLQAAFLALNKMSESGKSRAGLAAHDLQLKRAFQSFLKVKKSRSEWSSFEIILPKIPLSPPFPAMAHPGCLALQL